MLNAKSIEMFSKFYSLTFFLLFILLFFNKAIFIKQPFNSYPFYLSLFIFFGFQIKLPMATIRINPVSINAQMFVLRDCASIV